MRYLFLLFCICILSPSSAQDVPRDSAIFEPVKLLFTGMNRGDSAMVRMAFVSEPIFATIADDKGGNPTIQYDHLDKFLTAIGTPHPQPWSEPVWDVKIQSDGSLAQVWAKYAFYVGDKLSHCGVDAFQLIRGKDGTWRIFFVADTRRREGCEVPSFISGRFK